MLPVSAMQVAMDAIRTAMRLANGPSGRLKIGNSNARGGCADGRKWCAVSD